MRVVCTASHCVPLIMAACVCVNAWEFNELSELKKEKK